MQVEVMDYRDHVCPDAQNPSVVWIGGGVGGCCVADVLYPSQISSHFRLFKHTS